MTDTKITHEQILLAIDHDVTLRRQSEHVTLLTRAVVYMLKQLGTDKVVIPSAAIQGNQGIALDVDELEDGFHFRVSPVESIEQLHARMGDEDGQ